MFVRLSLKNKRISKFIFDFNIVQIVFVCLSFGVFVSKV